ncbi:MAG: YceH family protein [Verrucomicrobiales bacterium]|nr:YceH family protein [Verrucomicrobiales bacterium]
MDTDPSDSTSLLDFDQTRVLGCLLEKEMTVPDTYPLTLNSLITACNQSTNRDPITDFDETTVLHALEHLRMRQWVFMLSQAGARVPKYRHNCEAKWPDLERPERALLCVMMLRGAQTPGELRLRTERMHTFADVESVEAALERLMHRHDGPLVKCLPAGGGRRVATYQHLLSGEVADLPAASFRAERHAEMIVPPEPSWKDEVERQLAELRQEIRDLKSQLGIAEDGA